MLQLFRKILMGTGLLLLIFSVGCSAPASNHASDVSANQKTKAIHSTKDNENAASGSISTGINSFASTAESESNSKPSMENSHNTTKEEAVKIAFAQAKKYQDKYNLIIEDNAISDYTCETKQKNGVVFYDITFKNIPLKNHTDNMKTQIGIWVNVNSGAVINVVQYK